jgi:hypothetical protein
MIAMKNQIMEISGWFFVLFLLIQVPIFAQIKPVEPKIKKPFMDRIYLGGSLGLAFGSKSTLIDVSPSVGYALTDDIIAGLGLTYKYYQYNDYFFDTANFHPTDLKISMYGFSIFARYFLTKTEMPIIENAFLHAEIEPLTFVNNYKLVPYQQGEYLDVFGNYYIKEKEKINVTGLFLGGGLRQLIGERSYLYIEVLWNFNEELYSPYSNPRIRIGLTAGL